LDASLLQARLAELHTQLATVEASLAQSAQPSAASPSGPVEAAIVSWAVSQALGEVLRQGPHARTKALLRILIGEIRVVSPNDIRPTYRVPGAVRIPNDLVGEPGFEPGTRRI
jgi:hypothetical protein